MRVLVFLSSFALFALELHVARVLLPVYGSSAAVWTTCLAVFQLVLCLGYWVASRLPIESSKPSAALHAAVVVLPGAALLLPLQTPAWPPALAVAATVLLGFGAPLLALSTTGVLAQRWHAATRFDPPWFLYRWSNAGSLVALAAYPLVVERFVGLRAQRWGLVMSFGVVAVLHLVLRPRVTLAAAPSRARSGARELARWTLLGAAGSALLTAVSQWLSLDAPSPLLWALPLAVYLLTFILAGGWQKPSGAAARRGVALGLVVAAAGQVLVLVDPNALEHAQRLTLLGLLFAGAWWAHATLFSRAPSGDGLGAFYLALSVGSALGSAAITFGCLFALAGVPFLGVDLLVALTILVLAALSLPSGHRRLLPLLAVLVVGFWVVALDAIGGAPGRLVDGARSFYGVSRVYDDGVRRTLKHGNTVHGVERRDAPGEPLTYFHRGSPVGTLLSGLGPKAVAIVGLGAGSLAAYSRPGDRYTFFELDPLVQRLAAEHFGFLRGAQGALHQVAGDARLTLRASDQRFEVVVIDAFSSDFVPAHLLTVEAFGDFLARLEPGGVLVVHVSNRVFDLVPQVGALAAAHGRRARVWLQRRVERPDAEPSLWVVVGEPEALDRAAPLGDWKPAPVASRAWSDDRTWLFDALR